MRPGPGVARTILFFHILSARRSKLPPIVRTFLKVQGARLLFLFLQEQIKRHHHGEFLRLLFFIANKQGDDYFQALA